MFASLETGRFAVEDMRTGNLYYSTPSDADADGTAFGADKEALQSEILVTDIVESDGLVETKNSYGGSLLKGGTVVSKTENGIQVLYINLWKKNTPFRWSTFCARMVSVPGCFATKSWNRVQSGSIRSAFCRFLAQGQPRTGTVFTGAGRKRRCYAV